MEKYSFDEAQNEAREIRKRALISKNGRGELDSADYQKAERPMPRELTKFMLPTIYRVLEYQDEEIFATVYDGVRLAEELRKQRAELNTEDSYTALAKDLLETFMNPLPEQEARKINKIPKDYIQTNDNILLNIFTNNPGQLAQDLFDFFSNKLTFIIENDASGHIIKNQDNITEEMKELLLKNLAVTWEGKIDQKIESMDGDIDVLFSVYPEIEHQIRFGSLWPIGLNEEDMFTFLNFKDRKFIKKLSFNHYHASKGFINTHCDLLTQLELLEFLKQKGHIGALQLINDAHKYNDAPDKVHYSFAI